MYYLNDFCCICLCNKKILQQISTTDNDNITYLSKIISSIPEMRCRVINNQRLLCEECCDNINITYKFRQQCLRSKTMLMDYISQLRSISNVSGKISIRLTDFQLQQDKLCLKSEDKNEGAIDTLGFVNEMKTEPNEIIFVDCDHIQMNNILKEEYIDTDCMDKNYNFALDGEVKNEIETHIDYQITNYSRTLFINQAKEVINESEVNLNDQKNSEKELHPDKIPSTNFSVNVCVETKIKKEVTTDNLNLLNDVKTEPNEANSIVIDGQLTEDLIIKTEDNAKDDEDYIDEYNDLSFNGESKNTTLKRSICKKIYVEPSKHSAHMRTHTGKLSHECTVCKKKFPKLCYLVMHKKTHYRICPNECSICKKTFNNSGSLTRHMRIHTGERSYECTVCKKTFNQSGHRKLHMRTHTGERPYKCTVCKKTFNRSGSLTVHMRTHTGERPYECTVCKKVFNQSCHLKLHMRTHTEERPYECTVCKKAFNQSGNLKLHMRTHTGERPNECTVCKKTFVQSGILKEHMRTHSKKNL